MESCSTVSFPRPTLPPVTSMVLRERSGMSLSGVEGDGVGEEPHLEGRVVDITGRVVKRGRGRDERKEECLVYVLSG